TPEIPTNTSRPLPRLAVSVIADAVNDVAVDLIQRLPHHDVRLLQHSQIKAREESFVRAVIVFEQVDAPARPHRRILLLVLVTASASAGGSGTWRRVNAKLEAARVDVVRERFHVREFLVWWQLAIRVALAFPTVVDIDELKAVRREAGLHHPVGGGFHF